MIMIRPVYLLGFWIVDDECGDDDHPKGTAGHELGSVLLASRWRQRQGMFAPRPMPLRNLRRAYTRGTATSASLPVKQSLSPLEEGVETLDAVGGTRSRHNRRRFSGQMFAQ